MNKVNLLFLSFFLLLSNLVARELTTQPENPIMGESLTLTYRPSANQQWLHTQNAYLYACVELDSDGEWTNEKSEWSKSNVPSLKWLKEKDGTLSYTISNLRTYFNLSEDEVERVSGMFVIIKNERYQTDDIYIDIAKDPTALTAKFEGTVDFEVEVPLGTKKVYVAGNFGEENGPLYWKHAVASLELTKKDATHFQGTIKNVPENLYYMYVWGERVDQAEFRMAHRPLGGRTQVSDHVVYWGDQALNVTVPAGTREVYVSGSFNDWTYSQMMDAGNNTWTFHIPPTNLKEGGKIEYRYFNKDEKSAAEHIKSRSLQFEGFSTKYDEVNKW